MGGWGMENPRILKSAQKYGCSLSGYEFCLMNNSSDMVFYIAHQGYLPLGVSRGGKR